jgi:lipoate-protein ligase A
MKYLELTLPTPQENLACDEALLDFCEEGFDNEILRFWASPEPFVVLGYSNKTGTEVNLEAARRSNVPVLRRCTGGGAVVQGRGCLNYSLILKIPEVGLLASVTDTNVHIMQRHRDALAPLLKAKGGSQSSVLSGTYPLDSGTGLRACPNPTTQAGTPVPPKANTSASSQPSVVSPHPSTLHAPRSTALSSVSVRGHSDLTLGDLKFSGNAQRRKRRFLLFHGTFLLGTDIELIERVLPMPSRQPEYRQNRQHRDFLTNVNVAAPRIQEALQESWQAMEPLNDVPLDQVFALAKARYSTDDWNFKF